MSLKLEHVTYTYNPGTAYETHALKDVSLEIPQGQFVGVIGHTGSPPGTVCRGDRPYGKRKIYSDPAF